MFDNGESELTFDAFIKGMEIYVDAISKATSKFWPSFFMGIFLSLLIKFLTRKNSPPPGSKGRVCLLVLGDFYRSPRMQYHAHSLARNGFFVDVVAYGSEKDSMNSKLFGGEEITKFISFHYLSDVRFQVNGNKAIFMIKALVKISLQVLILFRCLLISVPSPTHYLVQNPPAIPSLFVLCVAKMFRGGKIIIDWHNYGFTILNMKFQTKIESDTRPANFIVSLARAYENFFGRFSSGNFSVTEAMKDDLDKNWGIKAVALHDKAPEIFKALEGPEKDDFLRKLDLVLETSGEEEVKKSFKDFHKRVCNKYGGTLKGRNVFTGNSGKFSLEKKRPALLVSSTSWTEDEDFGVLLDALVKYDTSCEKMPERYPMIVCVITGRGPQKEFYEKKISDLSLKNVFIKTLWLASEDYPRLLGCCDAGISLHLSSSGLDLPMKVVDMFGCNLPVFARGFPCLEELVQAGRNGMIFKNGEELFKQLRTVLAGFPEEDQLLLNFRKRLAKERAESRWNPNWDSIALPVFLAKE